jgi:hypothetical protein
VILQSQTCDFAITGSVLQSWFKPNSGLNFEKNNDFPNDHFLKIKINLIKDNHFEKLLKGTPHEPLSPPNNRQGFPELINPLGPFRSFLVQKEYISLESV